MDRAARDAYYETLKVPLLVVYIINGGICHLCGGEVAWQDASRDHVKPVKHGGRTVWQNIRLAHQACNSVRGHAPINNRLRSRLASRRQNLVAAQIVRSALKEVDARAASSTGEAPTQTGSPLPAGEYGTR